ncbi:MAG: sulfatase-like hydrolase/transferase [Nannocystaceae bacterium]
MHVGRLGDSALDFHCCSGMIRRGSGAMASAEADKRGKRGRRRRVVAVILLALIAALALAWSRYWYYLPGILAALRDPVEANHPVEWQQGPAEAPEGPRPPNIVFILVDDLGFNDLSYHGGGVVPTPNIDAIAREGVIFSRGYAGNATCAPSRAAVMTGRYATRFGFEFTPAPKAFERLVGHYRQGSRMPIYHEEREDALPPLAEQRVPEGEIMLPELLGPRGYHTVFLGKWHLGDTPGTRPEDRGFDEALGFMPGASRYARSDDPAIVESYQDFDPIDKFLWANLPFAIQHNGGRRFEPSGYLTDYLAEQAVAAIEANRNRPFFLYLAFNAVHTPLQALRADYDALPEIEDHRLRVYAAMIRAPDRDVGAVMDALERHGLADDTLVIFTSDNGGANYLGLPDINKPYRGWKATFFEGGVHVPFFARWPGHIPAGATYPYPVGHVDIYATAAAAAGVEVPRDRVIDGVDLLPFLGGLETARPHQTLYWRSGPYKALLDGDWKLQISANPPKAWLFDLKADPTESTDLAESNPAVVESLKASLDAIDGQQSEPSWPSLFEAPVAIDHPLSYPDDPSDVVIYWAN